MLTVRVRVMVFKATFNNISVISWRSVLLVEETGENYWPIASHWQTLSLNFVSSTPRLSGVRTHNVGGDRHWYKCWNMTSIHKIKLDNYVFYREKGYCWYSFLSRYWRYIKRWTTARRTTIVSRWTTNIVPPQRQFSTTTQLRTSSSTCSTI